MSAIVIPVIVTMIASPRQPVQTCPSRAAPSYASLPRIPCLCRYTDKKRAETQGIFLVTVPTSIIHEAFLGSVLGGTSASWPSSAEYQRMVSITLRSAFPKLSTENSILAPRRPEIFIYYISVMPTYLSILCLSGPHRAS